MLSYTDILAFDCAEEGALCPGCALVHLYKEDADAFELVLIGFDTSLISPGGIQYEIIHEASIQFEQFPDTWFKDGLRCSSCGCECIPANE